MYAATMMRLAIFLAAMLGISCSGEDEQGGDAWDARTCDSHKKSAPAAAKAPKFVDWTCPAGWSARKVAAGTVVAHSVCQPRARIACAVGEVQLLGKPGCETIGTACPAGGGFHTAKQIRAMAPGFTGKILHVKPGAAGGDGSDVKPFGSMASALSKAADKDIIALFPGKHQESAIINKAVALAGSCVKETYLNSLSTHPGMLALKITRAGVLITNLRITGQKAGVLIHGVSGDVMLNDVEIQGSSSVALMTALGSPGLALDRVVIRDAVGPGIALGGDVKVVASNLILERIQGYGILVGSAGNAAIPQVKLTDLVIHDVTQRASASDGSAIRIEARANITIERCLLKQATDTGVVVTGGGSLTLSDCHLIDTRAGNLKQGRGLVVFDASKAVLTRAVVENNLVSALQAWGSGAKAAPKLELTDVLIRATGASVVTGATGCGLVVAGDVSGKRVLLEQNTDAAILVAAEKSSIARVLFLTDLAVLDTRGRKKDKGRGAGLVVDGGKVTLNRSLFARNRSHAIISGLGDATTAAPELILTDLIVRDTKPDEGKNLFGRGLEIQGSKISITRALIERNQDIALLITGATNKKSGGAASISTLSDVIIQDTQSATSSEFSGMGLVVQDGSQLTARWLVSRRNRGAGMLAMQKDSAGTVKLDLADVVISHTGRSACAEIAQGQPGSCIKSGVTYGGGSGLSVVGKVTGTLDRFDIHHNKLCGVQVAGGAALKITNGALHHNTIGINATGQGVDIKTLLDTTVRLHDNDTNLDASSLPVPDAAKTLQGLGF